MKDSLYLCIDLKSFYASVECMDRGLDTLTTKLVVADPTRGKGTICLAVSPALKALGVKNRCRVYEIPDNIEYKMATPRMKRYMDISVLIYRIYTKYVAEEDIHVYSIDECFLDVSNYMSYYNMDIKDLAKKIIKDVYDSTGIVATCGIGTNLYLAKIALDIISKKASDHIGYLDEEIFIKNLSNHKPLKDFWGISDGISNRLAKYNIYDMEGIRNIDEDILYKEFGINAELLIDHSYGKETTTMADINAYKSKSNSLSKGQVLFEDYNFDNALIVLKEMVDELTLDLIERDLVATSISLFIVYSSNDYINPSGGLRKLNYPVNSFDKLLDYFTCLYKETTNKSKPIRRIGIGVSILPLEFKQLDLFSDENEENKEYNLYKTIIDIKDKFGLNAILKANSLNSKATQKERNKFIGGHRSGED